MLHAFFFPATFFIWSSDILCVCELQTQRKRASRDGAELTVASVMTSVLSSGGVTPKIHASFARAARLDLTHRRAASSTLPPCWQLRRLVLLTVTKFVTLSHRCCNEGRQKRRLYLFTAIFTMTVYADDICNFQVDLNEDHTCFRHTSLIGLGILFPPVRQFS